jgi:hypothetical protein
MFRREQSEIVSFRCDYAEEPDFREVLERDIKPFYLLTFLLTASHKKTERCIVYVIEQVFHENGVFKAWVGPWIKRCLIKKAIDLVFSGSGRSDERRDLWFEMPDGSIRRKTVDAITALDGLERFVFVMSILEGYSVKDCSLLLDCTMENAVRMRVEALHELAKSNPVGKKEDLARASGRRRESA